MRNKIITVLLVIVVLLLGCEVAFLLLAKPTPAPVGQMQIPTAPLQTQAPAVTEAAPTQAPAAEPPAPAEIEAPTQETAAVPMTEAPTEPATEEATEEPTEEPTTEPPTEAPTEPQAQHYTITFVGDCTLGTEPKRYGEMYSFIWTIGEDYDFPFRNVVEYFRNDDLTIANLEGNFTDQNLYSTSQFSFRGPTAYTQILTGSSVELVTLANNHTMDFGQAGYQDTTDALDAAGVAYAQKDKYVIYKTESGLTVGVYGAAFTVNGAAMRSDFQRMRQAGVDIIIVAIHWGVEGAYRPNSGQVSFAHEAIDYGADIVYGSHPHVLQPIEEYKNGIIYYSMGNFSFGGNHWPPDLDSVVLQQEIIRELDGTVHLGELTRIPCKISSITATAQNNFQPTPYEEGSAAYERTMKKLDGTFEGGNLDVNY